MEEKIKLSSLKNVDSTGSLHQKYQELLKALQSKDELISQLEAQLEKQVGTNVRRSLFTLSASGPVGLSVSNPVHEPRVIANSLFHETVLLHGDH